MLTRDQILKAKDLPVRKVDTPEWGNGTHVFVRSFGAEEAESLADWGKDEDGESLPNTLGRFAALLVCDEFGDRIFKDEDAGKLGKKNPKVLERIMDKGLEHNGMNKKAAEDLEKNSGSGPGAASSSD